MAIGIYHHNRGLVTVDKMNNRWYLFDFKKLIYFALVFVAIKKFKKHPIVYIAASAVVGLVLAF